MKFLCIPCDEPMKLQQAAGPEAGSLDLRFRCALCGHEVAMLTNAGETQLVQSLGVRVGRDKGPITPMVQLRTHLAGAKSETLTKDTTPEPIWTEAAETRLAEHPRFVQPVIRKTYTDYARRQGLHEISPEVMNEIRRKLGAL